MKNFSSTSALRYQESMAAGLCALAGRMVKTLEAERVAILAKVGVHS
jgi:hypothetical protein